MSFPLPISRWAKDLCLSMAAGLSLLCTCLVVGVLTAPTKQRPRIRDEETARVIMQAEAETNYQKLSIHGFDVFFNRSCFEPGKDVDRSIVQSLAGQLNAMNFTFPPESLERIRHTKLWVEWDATGYPRPKLEPHHDSAAYYLPQGSWYKSALPEPCKAGSIVIHAKTMLHGIRGEVLHNVFPYWLAHELAHAHHDQVLGYDDPKVISTYRAAMDAKLYDDVAMTIRNPRHDPWERHESAYAAKHECEYFAELTVTYLSWNPYYPHTRSELARHDPRGYALMSNVWGDNAYQRGRIQKMLVQTIHSQGFLLP